MKKSKHQKYKKLVLIIGIVIVLFVLGVVTQQPSNDRDWVDEFAVLPQITVNNDTVTFSNLRDWKYAEGMVVSRDYIDASYDSRNLTQVWFLQEPFSSWNAVAHTYLTFEFDDQPPISFSIEARREQAEEYTAFQGMLNKFEVAYLWGTERDFLLRRTERLGNKVYMVPLTITPEQGRQLFLSIARSSQEVAENPRFYNTAFSNCTNLLADEVNKSVPGTLPWNPYRLLTGYSGRYLAENGYLQGVDNWDEDKDPFLVNQYLDDYDSSQPLEIFIRVKLPKTE